MARRICRQNVRMADAASLTDLIQRAQDGDSQAFREVFDATYQELRQLARQRLSRGGRGTLLDTTALVHESFMRFANAGSLKLNDRNHFLRYASHVMRSVIVDIARASHAQRRGGDALHVTLNTEAGERSPQGEEQILRVHETLEELHAADPRLVQVVEMRYFAGMTEADIATTLGISERTVRRDWEKARLFLAQALA
jgi:RNA polymerase sigma factor (TIGR02999 family)